MEKQYYITYILSTYVQVYCDVDVDDVSILQNMFILIRTINFEHTMAKTELLWNLKFPRVRYAMAHALIYWGAHTLWETPVAKWWRISTSFNNHLVHSFINFVCCHWWLLKNVNIVSNLLAFHTLKQKQADCLENCKSIKG